MNAPLLSLIATSVVWLAAAPAANAGLFGHNDDCAPGTQNARAESAAEHCNARRFEGLDCRGLSAYAEGYRTRLNQQLLMTRYGPVAESAPESGPLPQVRPLPAPLPSEPPTPTPIPDQGPASGSKPESESSAGTNSEGRQTRPVR